MKKILILFGMLLASTPTLVGQGPTMTPHYDSYVSYSVDGNGNTLQTVVVEGYTTGSCSWTYVCGPYGQTCTQTDQSCATAYHYPKTNNVLGSIGGWTTGPSVNPFAYMSYQTTSTLYIAPGDQVPATWEGDAICSVIGPIGGGGGSGPVLGITPIQHNYPRNPLPQACRVSRLFDAPKGDGKHKAEDVMFDDGNGGNTEPPLGTPVTAMESGTVVGIASGNPSAGPIDGCKNLSPASPGNYVKIQSDSDLYYTVYFHMTPTVSLHQHVDAGQQIGILDDSGCHSLHHVHVQRKDTSGVSVNFTIPCTNQNPVKTFADGFADDNDPDEI